MTSLWWCCNWNWVTCSKFYGNLLIQRIRSWRCQVIKVMLSSNWPLSKPWKRFTFFFFLNLCFLYRLLFEDWLGYALKAYKTLTFSSLSSLDLWILSYSAATWRRVLCSKCGRGKVFSSLFTPNLSTHLWTQLIIHFPFHLLFILNLFLHKMESRLDILATSIGILVLLSFFLFFFLTSVASQLQMLKCLITNMTDCHGCFPFFLLSLFSLHMWFIILYFEARTF